MDVIRQFTHKIGEALKKDVDIEHKYSASRTEAVSDSSSHTSIRSSTIQLEKEIATLRADAARATDERLRLAAARVATLVDENVDLLGRVDKLETLVNTLVAASVKSSETAAATHGPANVANVDLTPIEQIGIMASAKKDITVADISTIVEKIASSSTSTVPQWLGSPAGDVLYDGEIFATPTRPSRHPLAARCESTSTTQDEYAVAADLTAVSDLGASINGERYLRCTTMIERLRALSSVYTDVDQLRDNEVTTPTPQPKVMRPPAYVPFSHKSFGRSSQAHQ